MVITKQFLEYIKNSTGEFLGVLTQAKTREAMSSIFFRISAVVLFLFILYICVLKVLAPNIYLNILTDDSFFKLNFDIFSEVSFIFAKKFDISCNAYLESYNFSKFFAKGKASFLDPNSFLATYYQAGFFFYYIGTLFFLFLVSSIFYHISKGIEESRSKNTFMRFLQFVDFKYIEPRLFQDPRGSHYWHLMLWVLFYFGGLLIPFVFLVNAVFNYVAFHNIYEMRHVFIRASLESILVQHFSSFFELLNSMNLLDGKLSSDFLKKMILEFSIEEKERFCAWCKYIDSPYYEARNSYVGKDAYKNSLFKLKLLHETNIRPFSKELESLSATLELLREDITQIKRTPGFYEVFQQIKQVWTHFGAYNPFVDNFTSGTRIFSGYDFLFLGGTSNTVSAYPKFCYIFLSVFDPEFFMTNYRRLEEVHYTITVMQQRNLTKYPFFPPYRILD